MISSVFISIAVVLLEVGEQVALLLSAAVDFPHNRC